MAKGKIQSNSECKNESHNQHLCYIVSQGFHISDPNEYNALIKNPKFKCQHCGQVANKAENLCKPTNL